MGVKRKGFYFSFDAFLALTVMVTSLLVVGQSSKVASDPFRANSISYKKADINGQDAMRLASRQKFTWYSQSFQDELVDKTVMEKKDLNRTILDGITLLWAARNISHAEEATQKYFDSQVPKGYNYSLRVNEGGSSTTIHESSKIPSGPGSVASVSRLVSGHQIDKPSEGFQSRARASGITKNITQIVPMPPLGAANANGDLEVEKKFDVEDVDKIHNATFYMAVHYNGDSKFENFKINGRQHSDVKFDWIYDDGTVAYGTLDVTSKVEGGANNISVKMNSAPQSFHSHFHPGTKLEVSYSTDRRAQLNEKVHKRIYLENIISGGTGATNSGIFSTKQFTIPDGAEIINASYHLHGKSMEGAPVLCNESVRVLFNGDKVYCGSHVGDFEKEINLPKDDIEQGTNVLTTYLNQEENQFFGGMETQLYSDFETDSSSHIDIWYNKSSSALRYGQIKISASEKIGAGPDEPLEFDVEFDHDDLASTKLYMAQNYSYGPKIEAKEAGQPYETVFDAPAARSAPTSMYIAPKYYDVDSTNTLRLSDEAGQFLVLPQAEEGEPNYLPESTFQKTFWIDSLVGYGSLFPNRTAAENDARNRLKDHLGDFADASTISEETVSTGSQPYLWGPASIKLVVWK